MKNKKLQEFGFTIAELLVVIVVIAILASIGFVSYKRIIDKGQAAATKNIVQQYSKVFGAYYADNGRYPEFADLDQAEANALPENQKNGGVCIGTGYVNGCGSDLGLGGELESFNNLLKEYVGQKPPSISPHDIPLVIDPGNGVSMRIRGVIYNWMDPLDEGEIDDGGNGTLNGDNTKAFSFMVYALDETDAQCVGGEVLSIVDMEGNFVTDGAKNTLHDDENTACAVLLPE